MRRSVLFVLAVVMISAATSTGVAQSEPAPDIYISTLTVEPSPVVNVSSVVTALVKNPSDTDVLVEFSFRYEDNTPLVPPDPLRPDPVGHRMVVPARSERNASLAFTPDSGRSGEREIVVVADVRDDPNPENNTMRLPVFVKDPRLGLTFETPTRAEVLSEGTGFLRFVVRNLGNAPDVPKVNLSVNGSWVARLARNLSAIPPGESGVGVVILDAKTDNETEIVHLNLTATSGILDAVNVTRKAPTLRVNQSLVRVLHAVRLDPPPSTVQVFPGESVNRTFTLTNVGDARDVLQVNATLPGAPAGWEARIEFPGNATRANETNEGRGPLLVELEPQESRTLLVNVTRKEAASNETATIDLVVSSNNSRLLAAAFPNEPFNATSTVKAMDAAFDLAVARVNIPPLVYRGEDVAVIVTVRNDGRMNATNATIRLDLRDNLRSVANQEFPIRPLAAGGQTAVVWSVSAEGLSGAYALSARLLPPPGDASEENDRRSVSFHVRSPRLLLHGPEEVVLVPGSTLILTGSAGGFSVENGGDREETVVVRLDSEVDWLSASWRIDVPAGGHVVIPVRLDVPRFPHIDSAAATFRASVDGHPSFNASRSAVFRLDDVDGPELTFLAPVDPGRVGKASNVVVRAEDATGVARVEAIIASPDGERLLLVLEGNSSRPGIHTGAFTPRLAGDHVIEIRSEDFTPQGFATVLPNVTWSVLDAAYAGLQPVGFQDGGRIGSRTLRFEEVEPSTTLTAFVNVGTGFQSLTRPYEIQVPSWTEGQNSVRVRATSIQGVVWERSWNVTLDTTPPSVGDVTLRDMGQGRLEVSVLAPGAVKVEARFDIGGGSVPFLLDQRGADSFAAVANPPPSWRSITVVAIDDVGNQNSSTTEAGRDAPAPALLVSVLVAVAVALAIRRRD